MYEPVACAPGRGDSARPDSAEAAQRKGLASAGPVVVMWLPMISDRALADFDTQVRQSTRPDEPGALIEADGTVVRWLAPDGQGASCVTWSRLDERTVDAAIAEQVEFFRARQQQFEWKLYDYDRPADLALRLLAAGFVADDEELLMAAETAQVAAEADHPVLSGSLEQQLDSEPPGRRGIECADERDRHRGPGGVVPGGGAERGTRQVQQERCLQDEDRGRDQLGDLDRGPIRAAVTNDGHREQPDQFDDQPAHPPRGEPAAAGEPLEPGAGGAHRIAVSQPGAAGVVVGGDDQPDLGGPRRMRLGRGPG